MIGAGPRRGRCPCCKSTDRERLVFLYLFNQTQLFKTKRKIRLLHIAPEKILSKYIRRFKNIIYHSVDIKEGKGLMVMDIQKIDFNSDFFDVIICNHVLEHVNDDKKAMTELFRVLKKKGWAILQVPLARKMSKTHEDFRLNTRKSREIAFGQHNHVRLYGRDFPEKLKKIGFLVNVESYAKKVLGKEFCKLHGINIEEEVYFCKK